MTLGKSGMLLVVFYIQINMLLKSQGLLPKDQTALQVAAK